jgi:hypothetical protein
MLRGHSRCKGPNGVMPCHAVPCHAMPCHAEPGPTRLQCKVLLFLDNQPEVYKLDLRLARVCAPCQPPRAMPSPSCNVVEWPPSLQLLGLQTATRTTVTLALWEYVKVCFHALAPALPFPRVTV